MDTPRELPDFTLASDAIQNFAHEILLCKDIVSRHDSMMLLVMHKISSLEKQMEKQIKILSNDMRNLTLEMRTSFENVRTTHIKICNGVNVLDARVGSIDARVGSIERMILAK